MPLLPVGCQLISNPNSWNANLVSLISPWHWLSHNYTRYVFVNMASFNKSFASLPYCLCHPSLISINVLQVSVLSILTSVYCVSVRMSHICSHIHFIWFKNSTWAKHSSCQVNWCLFRVNPNNKTISVSWLSKNTHTLLN